jgi:hypothetical protein
MVVGRIVMQGDLSGSLSIRQTQNQLEVEEEGLTYTPSRTTRFGAYLKSRSRKTWIITGVSVALVVLVATVVIGVAVGTAVGVTESEETQQRRAFNNWMVQWNMTYAEEEYELRFAIFQQNLQIVQQHSSSNYQLGLNKFAAMTTEELNSYRGAKPPANFHHNRSSSNPTPPREASFNGKRGDIVNWVTAGKVSAVEYQGQCGCCWAFAAAGAITSYISITTGVDPNSAQLSEQYLLDCSGSAGNIGCNGGWPGNAYSYAQQHGIPVEGEYTAYHASQGSCSLSNACGLPGSVTVTGWGYVNQGDENALLNQLQQTGPLAVAIDASPAFIYYTGGVFDGPCNDAINHAVLLVGAGTDQSTGQAYWLVKNQWGSWWGENGYARIARNAGNMCSIASFGQYVMAQHC